MTYELPNTVKVGWKTFALEVWDSVDAARAHKYGECDHLAGVIRVDRRYGDAQFAETLLHELMHAAFDIGGINRVRDDERYSEEAVVSFLSTWMMTLFCDNPWLLGFLHSVNVREPE